MADEKKVNAAPVFFRDGKLVNGKGQEVDKNGQVKEVAAETDASDTNDLREQLETLQRQSEADAAVLAEYRDVVGELLPADFPSRKILLDNGYYTVDSVTSAEDPALNGLKGISDAKLAEIRKVAPFTAPE